MRPWQVFTGSTLFSVARKKGIFLKKICRFCVSFFAFFNRFCVVARRLSVIFCPIPPSQKGRATAAAEAKMQKNARESAPG
jgi:hypothetical protein